MNSESTRVADVMHIMNDVTCGCLSEITSWTLTGRRWERRLGNPRRIT
jgi:hypothetical protein